MLAISYSCDLIKKDGKSLQKKGARSKLTEINFLLLKHPGEPEAWVWAAAQR